MSERFSHDGSCYSEHAFDSRVSSMSDAFYMPVGLAYQISSCVNCFARRSAGRCVKLCGVRCAVIDVLFVSFLTCPRVSVNTPYGFTIEGDSGIVWRGAPFEWVGAV